MVLSMDKGIVCKKCGKVMYIISESEKLSDSSRRICYYYKCPSCGFRIDLEYINVAPSNEFIIVKRKILLHPFLSSSL